MKSAIVLGGKTGLLGQALCAAMDRRGWAVHAPGREDLDLFDRPAVEEYLARTKASVLFNTVAYTKVDQAEDEPAVAHGVHVHRRHSGFEGAAGESQGDAGSELEAGGCPCSDGKGDERWAVDLGGEDAFEAHGFELLGLSRDHLSGQR